MAWLVPNPTGDAWQPFCSGCSTRFSLKWWNFDDFLWLPKQGGSVLATLLALGTPLSWKKTHLAEVNTWLGFVVHPNILQVLMAANKHILVMEVLQIMVEGQARRPWVGNGRMSAGEIDAPATLGLEDGHHHGGETP